jgi:hypothetical protein
MDDAGAHFWFPSQWHQFTHTSVLFQGVEARGAFDGGAAQPVVTLANGDGCHQFPTNMAYRNLKFDFHRGAERCSGAISARSAWSVTRAIRRCPEHIEKSESFDFVLQMIQPKESHRTEQTKWL